MLEEAQVDYLSRAKIYWKFTYSQISAQIANLIPRRTSPVSLLDTVLIQKYFACSKTNTWKRDLHKI